MKKLTKSLIRSALVSEGQLNRNRVNIAGLQAESVISPSWANALRENFGPMQKPMLQLQAHVNGDFADIEKTAPSEGFAQ